MQKKHCFALAAVLALLMVGGCGPVRSGGGPFKSTGQVIKIGYIGNEGGYGGSECLKGVKLAVADVNAAGGVLGKKVELLQGNYGSDSSRVVKVTQDLINQGVVAIVGDNTTGYTKLAATVCQSGKVLLVSPTATGAGVEEMGDYIFRVPLLDSYAVPVVCRYLHDTLHWRRVALIKDIGRTYTEGLGSLFVQALVQDGIKIVTEQKIRCVDTNFTQQVKALKKYHFDGIIFPGDYYEALIFLKEMRQEGITQPIIGGDGLFTRDLIKQGGADVEGTMAYSGFAWDKAHASAKTKAFVRQYAAAYGGLTPDEFSVQAFDAANLVFYAITQCGTTNTSTLKDFLAGVKNWQGASGTLSFDRYRQPVKSPVYLVQVEGGKFKLKATLPVTGIMD